MEHGNLGGLFEKFKYEVSSPGSITWFNKENNSGGIDILVPSWTSKPAPASGVYQLIMDFVYISSDYQYTITRSDGVVLHVENLTGNCIRYVNVDMEVGQTITVATTGGRGDLDYIRSTYTINIKS